MLVTGQVHGGVAQGIGQALYEGVSYDADGQLLTASYQDYCVPRADDIPPIAVTLDDSAPCRTNPLGAKGCGESGAIGGPPCITNGVMDALERTRHQDPQHAADAAQDLAGDPAKPRPRGRKIGTRRLDGAQRNPGTAMRTGRPRIALRSIQAANTPRMTTAKSCSPRAILLLRCGKSWREISMRRLWTVLAALATLSLTNCGYNAIQTNDEQVKSAWSEVLNQYQRRADLVPNLVNSVKGFAQQEKDVLLGVTNARAKVGSIQATPELVNDPGAFAKFQAAQGELTSALSKLLVVTENYPQLKSDALFRDLMAQLEGTENRITVARNRYIKTVQDYNVDHPLVPDQSDGDGVRVQGEGELHGRQRKGNLDRAEGRFQSGAGGASHAAAAK